MKTLFCSLITLTFLFSLNCTSEIPETRTIIFTTENKHKITTWVNDEPVLVCDAVYAGYNRAFWYRLRAGQNKVQLTAEILPDSVLNKVFGKNRDTPDVTEVRIQKGNIFSPEIRIFKEWKVSGRRQKSPVWKVFSNKSFRPKLDEYDNISEVNSEMKQQIASFLQKLREALTKKNLQLVNYSEEDYEDFGRELGIDFSFREDIYESGQYKVEIAPMEELRIIQGKKTIMLYHPEGHDIFHAGPSDEQPIKGNKFYFRGEEIFFVKKEGQLEPLWYKYY